MCYCPVRIQYGIQLVIIALYIDSFSKEVKGPLKFIFVQFSFAISVVQVCIC